MRHLAPARTLLEADQALHLHASSGAMIVCVRGALRLDCTAQWLADHMVAQQLLLNEGQAHLLEHSGWISVHAEQASDILMLLPGRPLDRVRHWLFTTVAGLLRQRRI